MISSTSAKRKKKARLKPVGTRKAPIRRAPLDRLADWIGQRSRFVRVLMCIGVATVLTIDLVVLLYGALLRADPNKLTLGPLNADNLSYVLLFFVVVAGFALYWLGWRLLIGFDNEQTPLQPGQVAALWLLIGLVAFIFTITFGSLTLINALQG